METLVHGLEKNVVTIADKVEEFENRSRRNNIIIHGLDEPEDETMESLLHTVRKDFLQHELNVAIAGIEGRHRHGAKSSNKCRPVIIKLIDYREQVLIFKNCAKLKGSNQYVTEDFSDKVRTLRKIHSCSAKN